VEVTIFVTGMKQGSGFPSITMTSRLLRSVVDNLPRLPPKEAREGVGNPIKIIGSLTWTQQALFWVGWLAWFADSFDL
jgi:hypothetical protein